MSEPRRQEGIEPGLLGGGPSLRRPTPRALLSKLSRAPRWRSGRNQVRAWKGRALGHLAGAWLEDSCGRHVRSWSFAGRRRSS